MTEAQHRRVPDVSRVREGRLTQAIVQDIAVQAGQGVLQDLGKEHLGRSDAGIIAWCKIFTRELRAIAEGWPAKRWSRSPADVLPALGIDLDVMSAG